jgi:hypothetical protein
MTKFVKHKRIHYVYGTHRVPPEVDELLVQELKSRAMIRPDQSGQLRLKLPENTTPQRLVEGVGPFQLSRPANRHELRCVIDSVGTCITMPIVLHRPLPDGEIVSIGLVRRLRADKPMYSVRFEIQVNADVTKFDGKFAIVNFDWRLSGKDVGVASIWTPEGTSRVSLPADYMHGWADWDFVMQARQGGLGQLIRELFVPGFSPEELAAGDEQLLQLLRSVRQEPKLHMATRLANRVRELHLSQSARLSQSAGLQLIVAWQQEDRRRWQHQCRLQERLAKRRLDIYFNVVADLRKLVTAVFWMAKQTVPVDSQDRRIIRGGAGVLQRMLGQRFPHRYLPLSIPEQPEDCASCGSYNELSLFPVTKCKSCGIDRDVELGMIARGLQEAGRLIASGVFTAME